ncbi:hypothetical protein Anapl_09022 [Anas platyrhynchos]|uniref:Uncharacterized protein n=1 Tax=Anas platyrhynchos TaxID=8839 RepID=R0LAV3_ANAPL|nr:hypothetical protein Anapl_09022 [Anas platyrhynchos]
MDLHVLAWQKESAFEHLVMLKHALSKHPAHAHSSAVPKAKSPKEMLVFAAGFSQFSNSLDSFNKMLEKQLCFNGLQRSENSSLKEMAVWFSFCSECCCGIEKKNGEDEETLTLISELQAMFKDFLDSRLGKMTEKRQTWHSPEYRFGSQYVQASSRQCPILKPGGVPQYFILSLFWDHARNAEERTFTMWRSHTDWLAYPTCDKSFEYQLLSFFLNRCRSVARRQQVGIWCGRPRVKDT